MRDHASRSCCKSVITLSCPGTHHAANFCSITHHAANCLCYHASRKQPFSNLVNLRDRASHPGEVEMLQSLHAGNRNKLRSDASRLNEIFTYFTLPSAVILKFGLFLSLHWRKLVFKQLSLTQVAYIIFVSYVDGKKQGLIREKLAHAKWANTKLNMET